MNFQPDKDTVIQIQNGGMQSAEINDWLHWLICLPLFTESINYGQ